MASARRQPPLEIFQDPVTSFDHAELTQPRQSSSASSHLRPIKNVPSKRNIVFNPPSTGPNRPSPLKPNRQSSSPPKAVFSSKFNVISIPPPKRSSFVTDSPKKKSTFSTLNASSGPKPQKALFTTFPSSRPVDKENHNPQNTSSDSYAEGSDQIYGHKGPMKRTLMDAAPIQDRYPKKQKLEEAAPIHVPEPADMPTIEDDGAKPPYSYATLIGMSILRASNRRLTLAQIYKWISDTFVYYRSSETGWQNSIRHNLSLNKAFVKQERPKDDPGKGNYWAIEPGMEGQFMKDKQSRKPNALGIAQIPPLDRDTSKLAFGEALVADNAVPKNMTRSIGPRAAEEQDLSSDATLPASDPALQYDEADGHTNGVPTSSRVGHSSPPQMNSSPPVARQLHIREGTPPAYPHFPSSSRASSRKRKISTMNDSGYFSSLDSSALRPHSAGAFLTSEADLDRPKIKRGRAEEEIARIRHSSHDSPTKSRAILKQPTAHLAPSSSPSRNVDSALMLPPLTPATTFKLPPKPPQSVSPNTNLRNHRDKIRELVGSPVRDPGYLQDVPWSPAFNLENEPFLFDDRSNVNMHPSFDIFADDAEMFFSNQLFGSPEKRSAKRPRVDRATTTTTGNVLADITSENNNVSLVKSSTPSFKVPFIKSPRFSRSPSKSPSKSPQLNGGIFDFAQGDLFSGEFFNDEATDLSGVDILKGFQKIGGNKKSERQPSENVNGKPSLGRRVTSRF
ncbi:MAG: hypothetical protein M1837_002286 [Sclerophora amabilis]|nr:MAG: hypothetical protein M1837_002286 [Sclerophora amabilis]